MKQAKRALIVDDEAPARGFLRTLLAAHPEIQVVGEARNVTEAIEQFRTLRPDLIFLDIQMPKRDGFSLLPELIPVPDIIFVTAYDHFAVKAFEINAVDFLSKPVSADRLAIALTRLTDPVKRKAGPFKPDDCVFLHASREVCVVIAKDISFIEAYHNYSKVHLVHRKPIFMRRTMSEWSKMLPEEIFFRPYRSLIVNCQAITDIIPKPKEHSSVHFTGGQGSVELGRGASRKLRRKLHELM